MGFFARLDGFRNEGESLHSFARRLQIPLTSLRVYKAGGNPSPRRAIELAKRLGVTPGWLMFGEEGGKVSCQATS